MTSSRVKKVERTDVNMYRWSCGHTLRRHVRNDHEGVTEGSQGIHNREVQEGKTAVHIMADFNFAKFPSACVNWRYLQLNCRYLQINSMNKCENDTCRFHIYSLNCRYLQLNWRYLQLNCRYPIQLQIYQNTPIWRYLQFNWRYMQFNWRYLHFNWRYLQFNWRYLQFNWRYLQFNWRYIQIGSIWRYLQFN